MSDAYFIWPASNSSVGAKKPRTLTASFGDGYAQRARDGINNKPVSWTLKFAGRDADEASAIEDFLDAQGGASAFWWQSPTGYIGRFVCGDYSRTQMAGPICDLAAVFDEVFDGSPITTGVINALSHV